MYYQFHILKIITSFSHDIENVEDKSIENLKVLIEFNANKFSRDRFKVQKYFFSVINWVQMSSKSFQLYFMNKEISGAQVQVCGRRPAGRVFRPLRVVPGVQVLQFILDRPHNKIVCFGSNRDAIAHQLMNKKKEITYLFLFTFIF